METQAPSQTEIANSCFELHSRARTGFLHVSWRQRVGCDEVWSGLLKRLSGRLGRQTALSTSAANPLCRCARNTNIQFQTGKDRHRGFLLRCVSHLDPLSRVSEILGLKQPLWNPTVPFATRAAWSSATGCKSNPFPPNPLPFPGPDDKDEGGLSLPANQGMLKMVLALGRLLFWEGLSFYGWKRGT